MNRINIRRVLLLVIMIMLLDPFFPIIKARVAYESYTYNYWLDPVPSPHPYVPVEELSGELLGVGDFDTPSDLFVAHNGFIYIADTNNNRIVWFDQSFNFINELQTFGDNDSFNAPQGVYVTEDNHIYVADTENRRIVQFDQHADYVRSFDRPVTDLISDTTSFRPTKVVVDGADRIYALAIGINSGIVEINPDGTFQGFMGASEVNITPLEYVWRRFIATDEQRQRMGLILPTEYNNLYLDNEEFIFVTRGSVGLSDYGTDVIRRLNPTGVNVLRQFGYGDPIGDYFSRRNPNITRFNDITVTDYQVYTALDGSNGKLFAYDYDGHLLYVFGGNGNRFGNFRSAVAVDQYEEMLYVLDDNKNTITTFSMTDYGEMVHSAIRLHYEGRYQEVEQRWKEVLKLNANADIAYIGLGKAQLRRGEYQEAMQNLELAHDRNNYTKAFAHYRREWMIEHFTVIMTTTVILILLLLFINYVRKLRKRWLVKEVKR